MRRSAWFLVAFAVSAATIAAAAEGIGWQDAVARLAQERTVAETCASLLKKYGDDSAKARGNMAYTDAKAEYDAVIAGLPAHYQAAENRPLGNYRPGVAKVGLSLNKPADLHAR